MDGNLVWEKFTRRKFGSVVVPTKVAGAITGVKLLVTFEELRKRFNEYGLDLVRP